MSVGTEERSALGYRPALDGVRAIAVLAVVCYHIDGRGLPGGFLGVDAFFVLSGFLITSLLLLELERDRAIALVAFWGRRVRRLLPALLGVVAAVGAYAWWFADPMVRSTLRGEGVASLLYVANWRFITSGQSYFDVFSAPSPLRHLWSLAIEEQFYFVWPVVVLAAAFAVGRRSGATRVVVGAIAFVGAAISVAVMARLYDAADPSRAYFGTDARVHTILIGCLIAVIVLHWSPSNRATVAAVHAAGVCGLFGVIVAFCFASDRGPWLYHGGSVAFAVAVGVVVVAAAQPGGPIVAALGIAPARALGRISYGVYLWHWPLIIWMTPTSVHLDGAALNAARLAATLAAATFSYHLLEMPIRRVGWRGWGAGLAVPAVLGSFLVGLIVATSGATARPNYLGGGGRMSFALPCPEPSPAEHAEAAAAVVRADTVAGGRLRRVLVLGDSVACSLRVGFEATRPGSAVVSDASVIGCGVVAGRVVSESMRTPRYQGRCVRYSREALRDGMRTLGGRLDVVVIISTWERFDLVVGRRTLRAGSRAWEAELTRRYDRRIRYLHGLGAKVAIVLPAASTTGTFAGHVTSSNHELDVSMLRLDEFLSRYARQHPGEVETIDLASRVCPGGPPCSPVVAGDRLRPLDGTHFGPAGAVRIASWLWRQIPDAPLTPPAQRAGR